MTQVTFIGAGNIAYAIAVGLLAGGAPATDIVAADPMPGKLNRFSELGIRAAASNAEAVADADVVLLTVKPNIVQAACGEVNAAIGNALVISVAAGVTLASLQSWLGGHDALVRCMPNTPALERQGMTGAYPAPGVSAAQRNLAEQVLGAVGSLLWLPAERDLDAVTAVSGSGPADFFLLMELMQKSAEELGLAPDVARQLVVKTALGAATMVDRQDEDIAALRQAVTSPGGTTAAAIGTFLDGGLDALVQSALTAAHQRSIELSEK